MSLSLKNGKVLAKDGKTFIFMNEDEKRQMYEYKAKNKMELVPSDDSNSRRVIYVVGGSGAGKTTICGDYMIKYNKMFPDHKLYFFTPMKEDPIIKKLPEEVNVIAFDDDFLDYEYSEEDFKDSCCIFDDIDMLEPRYKKVANEIRDKIMVGGRHINTSCLITSHVMFEHSKTKLILRESHIVVFMPSQNGYDGARFLTQFCSVSPKDSKEILNLPTRWLYIFTNYPRICMYDKGIFIIGKAKIENNNIADNKDKIKAFYNL
jgi:hypothetical protein